MINIEYRPFRLKIDGHAGGVKGSDPVCAAVTSLAYTLAANLQEAEAAGRLRELSIELEDGHGEITCVPVAHYKSVIELLFRFVVKGMETIAENEQSVKLTVFV